MNKKRSLLMLIAIASMFSLSACSDPTGLTDSFVNGACEGKWSSSGYQECWSDDQAGCASWDGKTQDGGSYTFHPLKTCSDLGLDTTS